MNGAIEARIARVARARGCCFHEAARLVALAAVRRRNVKRRAAERLARAEAMWWWRKELE